MGDGSDQGPSIHRPVNIEIPTVRPAAARGVSFWLGRLASYAPEPIRRRLEFEARLAQAKEAVPAPWHGVLERSLRLDPSGELFLRILKAVGERKP